MLSIFLSHGLGAYHYLSVCSLLTPVGETKIEVNDKYFQSAEDKLRIKLYEEELLPIDKPLIKQLGEAKQVFQDVQIVTKFFGVYLEGDIA